MGRGDFWFSGTRSAEGRGGRGEEERGLTGLHFPGIGTDVGEGVQNMGQGRRCQVLGVEVAAVDCP